ncbi:MAG: hypothetical protein ACTSQB_02375, partial [Candidatus Heimdallarchaeota archaeon]
YSVSLEIPRPKSKQAIKGQIYDLRSQRYFPYLHSLFYRGAKGAIIIFDLTNKGSFDSVSKWRDIIWGHVGTIPLLLCGNKSDLRQKNDQQITLEEIRTVTDQLSLKQKFTIPYVEISALKQIVAYSDYKDDPKETVEIYPTLAAFRKPYVNWLIEIVKKGQSTKTK